MRQPGELSPCSLILHPPCRYEDNFDAVNTIMVLVKPAEKSKMEVRRREGRELVGSADWCDARLRTMAPPKLSCRRSPRCWASRPGRAIPCPRVRPVCAPSRALLTCVTGGFAPGKVSVANVLTAGSRSTGGKTYYQYEVLTRTADGDEGGRHHIFVTTVSGGKLYILKCALTPPLLGMDPAATNASACRAQAGDKRWFKVSVHDAMPLFSLTQYPRVSSGTLSACRPLSPLFKILQSTPYAFLAV